MRLRTLPVVAVCMSVAVSACSSPDAQNSSDPIAPQRSVAGQAVAVTPASLTFASPTAAAQTVLASTNFAGVISATVDAPNNCTVTPASQNAQVTPTSGGMKTASFSVQPVSAGSCVIHVSDKKGNTALVTAQVLPAANPCPLTLHPTSAVFSANASSEYPIDVVDPASCPITAVPDAPWVHVVTQFPNGGLNALLYKVDANPDPVVRTAHVLVRASFADPAVFTITQDAGICSYFMNLLGDVGLTSSGQTATATAAGGTYTLQVVPSSSQCGWTPTSTVSWIHINSPTGPVSGTALVSYTIDALSHAAADRSGQIVLANVPATATGTLAVTINQVH